MNSSTPHSDPDVRAKIVQLFLEENQSINHIVFLLDYQVGIDAVNATIREALRERMK